MVNVEVTTHGVDQISLILEEHLRYFMIEHAIMAPRVDHITNADWQSECLGAKERVAKLYQVEEWTDCSFEFEEEIIKAHKLILAMSSPVFAAMFYGGVAQKEGPIAIVDIQSDAFTALLEYIYTDEFNVQSLELACNLYYAAKKYMFPHLMKECVTYVTDCLEPSNVCQTYEFAKMHDETDLMNKCLQMFSHQTIEIFKGNNFKKAQTETIGCILSLDYLNIANELDLFKALARYAKALREREWLLEKNQAADVSEQEGINDSMTSVSTFSNLDRGGKYRRRKRSIEVPSPPKPQKDEVVDNADVDDSDSDAEKSDDDESDKTGSLIRSMLCKIRFLTLTPKEFADCRILNALLSKDEILAVSMNIASRHTSVPMPDGFSTTRIARNLSDDKSKKMTVFRSVVNNVRNLTYHESDLFFARNIPWYITVRPVYKTVNGNLCKAFAVFLYCALECAQEWRCRADYEFRLIAARSSARMPTFRINHLFSSKKVHCGCTLKWESIMDPQTGTLEDGQIGYEVKIAPEEPELC